MTYREAEDYLLGLELFGMRFGLDRMRRLYSLTRKLGGWRYGMGSEYEIEQTTFAFSLWRAIHRDYDGSSIVKRVPCGTLSPASMVPPCSAMIRRTIARPSPLPRRLVE